MATNQNRKSLMSMSDLFQSKRRYLMQVVLDEDLFTRAEAIKFKLGHKTLGRIWRYAVSRGLEDLEEGLKKGRK